MISAQSLTLSPPFFFYRILLNDTWHVRMDVIKIHGWRQPEKRLCWTYLWCLDRSTTEDLNDKHENLLIYWADCYFIALLRFYVYSISFFFVIIIIVVLLCVAALFFTFCPMWKQTRQIQKMCIFKKQQKQNTAFYYHVFFVLWMFWWS